MSAPELEGELSSSQSGGLRQGRQSKRHGYLSFDFSSRFGRLSLLGRKLHYPNGSNRAWKKRKYSGS